MDGGVNDKETAEVMDCLLSMSRANNDQIGEMQFWQNCDNVYQEGEQIIWKLDCNETTLHPVTVDKPVAYVVDPNMVPNMKEDTESVIGLNKVVLIQSLSQHQTSYADYHIVQTEAYEENKYVTEAGPSSSKTDSSLSETIDVEVEDIDEGEITPFQSKFVLGLGKGVRRGKKGKTGRGRKKNAKKVTAFKQSKTEKKSGKVKKSCSVPAKSNTEVPKPKPCKLNDDELTKLEDTVEQVAERLALACECSSDCYDGLSPEKVFRHRLNIADLTKAEHDMYLMGVILASMQNPDETSRKKERLRMRTTYSYHGKKVCLTAFLYLEHVTLYQLKRIRKHLLHHGVSPRIHGNHGRKPSNTLPLTIYQNATNFVQEYIKQSNVKMVCTKSETGKAVVSYKLPPDCTKRIFHNSYKRACQKSMPSAKFLQYSTFTIFLKKQFPNVKFRYRSDKSYERKFDENADLGKEERSRKSKAKSKNKEIQTVSVPVFEEDLPTKAEVKTHTRGPVRRVPPVGSPFVLVEASHVVLEGDSYVLQATNQI